MEQGYYTAQKKEQLFIGKTELGLSSLGRINAEDKALSSTNTSGRRALGLEKTFSESNRTFKLFYNSTWNV